MTPTAIVMLVMIALSMIVQRCFAIKCFTCESYNTTDACFNPKKTVTTHSDCSYKNSQHLIELEPMIEFSCASIQLQSTSCWCVSLIYSNNVLDGTVQ
ncbi:hypothetical protein Trydic_g3553 [Trypoxylus dichotomus]